MRRAQSLLRRCAVKLVEPIPGSFEAARLVTTSADTANYELEVLTAWSRQLTGHKLTGLRKEGRTPGILFSLPANTSQLVELDSKSISSTVRQYGRTGMASRRFILRVTGSNEEAIDYPVLPRQVHRNAVTDMIENVTFMHCPPERRVLVNVPVRLLGAETCPGVKRGGYLNLIRRKIRCSCPGDVVPAYVEVDVSTLELNQRVLLSDISFPPGVVVSVKETVTPVCKVAGRSQSD